MTETKGERRDRTMAARAERNAQHQTYRARRRAAKAERREQRAERRRQRRTARSS